MEPYVLLFFLKKHPKNIPAAHFSHSRRDTALIPPFPWL